MLPEFAWNCLIRVRATCLKLSQNAWKGPNSLHENSWVFAHWRFSTQAASPHATLGALQARKQQNRATMPIANSTDDWGLHNRNKCRKIHVVPRSCLLPRFLFLLVHLLQYRPSSLTACTSYLSKYFGKKIISITLHSESIARAKKILRNYFPRDCAKLSQSIAWNSSWGIVFGAIAQFCCCSLLSYCFHSMPLGIDLRNGHFVIAPKYIWRIVSGWIARKFA